LEFVSFNLPNVIVPNKESSVIRNKVFLLTVG
jgi:hypothetical protein